MTSTSTNRFKNPTLDRLDPDLFEKLDLPEQVEQTAHVLAHVVGDVSVMWSSGRNPIGVGAACIYVADCAIRRDERYTQVDLAEALGTSHPTIRKSYSEIPSVFFEHAEPKHFATLDREVVATLERFLEAEEDGEGINNLRLESLPETDD